MHPPLEIMPESIPDHGKFGAVRRHDVHTGVDLHTPEGTVVYAMEDGAVEDVGPFTGVAAGCPWWLDTDFVGVWGSSGYLVYGEVEALVKKGDVVTAGQPIARVKRVLRNDKGLPTSMLHLERYSKVVADHAYWYHNDPQPEHLVDPSGLIEAVNTR